MHQTLLKPVVACEVSLPILATILTEDILPREVVINEHGVYLHTWILTVYDDGRGCYFCIYLCRKNGIWASVSKASGKTWGYAGPLWDGDFVHPTLDAALLDAWKDFDRIEERFHEKPVFYEKARKAFENFMKLPYEDKILQFKIRD